MSQKTNFYDDNFCFVCGTENPLGLKIDFSKNEEQEKIRLPLKIPKYYQGWQNFVHGGILSAILDEAMIKAAFIKKMNCLTAELTVRFRKPVPVDTTLILTAAVISQRGKILEAEALLQLSDQTVLASARAKLYNFEN